jgi:hypothetical protein
METMKKGGFVLATKNYKDLPLTSGILAIVNSGSNEIVGITATKQAFKRGEQFDKIFTRIQQDGNGDHARATENFDAVLLDLYVETVLGAGYYYLFTATENYTMAKSLKKTYERLGMTQFARKSAGLWTGGISHTSAKAA